MIARIAVSAATYAIDRPYDYLIPEKFERVIRPGFRVFVPFGKGNRISEGIVLSVAETSAYPECKEILRPADEEALLSREQLQLALFMRERYFCTVYEAVRVMLPAGLWFDKSGRRKTRDKTREMVRLMIPPEEAAAYAEAKRTRAPRQSEILNLLLSFEILPSADLLRFSGSGRETLLTLAKKNLVELFQQEVLRCSPASDAPSAPLPLLSEEQTEALKDILRRQADPGLPQISLLQGVTGSGKTSIYAHLIERTLESGSTAILLVPEIALTPQMLSLFSSWFGRKVAVLHSGLSAGERCDEWKRIRRGDARLVIGTRSAVFSPVQKLGLLIIDEEQEDSYRSESVPRYHAREIARYRCGTNHAFLLLGSATPELTTRYLAQSGEYGHQFLRQRYNEKPLPAVQIVDMKQELMEGNASNLSRPLREAILRRIERGEQSILFLNRRGTNKLVTCSRCGYIYRCPHCSVSLTWHANRGRMICHYCGFSHVLDPVCPECGAALNFFGTGTQGLENELKDAFPGVGILRVDADTVSPLGSHQVLFRRFTEEKIPLMIGTQMIAKGLNFDRVTLVGIISADQGLYANDFRAGEKTFSLLAQVIGRCGRGDMAGEAVIQTFTPENEIIQLAAAQDYESFYHSELEMRRLQNAPPFFQWASITGSGKDEARVLKTLHTCRQMLETLLSRENESAEILGPVPLSVVKMNDRYRYLIRIRCRMNRNIRQIMSSVLIACSQEKEMRQVSLYADGDAGSQSG